MSESLGICHLCFESPLDQAVLGKRWRLTTRCTGHMRAGERRRWA